jgi:CubicO group peptidase (beta-lactamase class C family)
MQEGVAKGVFPGGVLLVSRDGELLFEAGYGKASLYTGRPVTRETVFDLASLTKPLATTLAVADLAAKGRMGLDQQIGEIFPEIRSQEKSRVRIDQLLAHVSGLPAYQPYYRTLCRLPAARRRKALEGLLFREPLVHSPGEATLYSDPGFMLLARAVERTAGLRLDRYTAQNLYQPLGLKDLFYLETQAPGPRPGFAATSFCNWRGRLLEGEVQDENAHCLGGIAGHAGLFGTGRAVHQLLSALLKGVKGDHPLFSQALLEKFLSPYREGGKAHERALGFDMPAVAFSSAGALFDRESTFGHLGFTGTSFWMEIKRGVIVVLLTNRVHPSPENEKIRQFRPRLHDCIMAAF